MSVAMVGVAAAGVTPPNPIQMRAPSVLLLGPTGTGKTHSLVTLIEAGLDLFVFVTEPNGLETLLDTCTRKGLPLDKLHYRVIEPARSGFDGLEKMAKTISVSAFDALAKMSPTSRPNPQFLTLVSACKDFVCDRCGKSFGPISSFGNKSAVALDSLSGISTMAMDLTIGDKVTAHQGEWGVAMGILDKLILQFTSDLKALFVLTAHIDREPDEVTGGTKLMASTLGRKLAPKIPRFFSEVVLCSTEPGGKYYWNTEGMSIDLKKRSLPAGTKLDPSFKPIVEAFNKRLEVK